VVAPALVVSTPDLTLDTAGRILVAPMTDPGWVFLMLSAAGLVVEKGSVLSHTAIVGRELGLPTVVGVAAATQRIATGQTLRVDGTQGSVSLLGEVVP
jgi:pyruvate,water dikinase